MVCETVLSMDLAAPVDHHLVGLVRVSTVSQDTQLQRDALVAVGCGRIFEEKVSTCGTERPGLAAASRTFWPSRTGFTRVASACGS